MISRVLIAALLGAVASAKDCQYFVSALLGGYPLGIDHCSYIIEGSTKMSAMVTCMSENYAKFTMYSDSFDCVGTHTDTIYGSSNATFDCTSTKAACGKAFGYKTPCSCTAKDGTCTEAISVSVVDEICVDLGVSGSIEYMITCGSLSKAQGTISVFSSSDCSGTGGSVTYKAGCQTSSTYSVGNATELDYIICPGNMATLSLSLLVGLIAAALAL